MYYLTDLCCICLCNKKILQKISTTDNDNITYLSKIISLVPEMSHSVMNDQRLLCKECCDNIIITYKFRQQCLRSETMLINYISQLRSVSNTSGKISIRLTDLQFQQDEVCVKSIDKNEETIDKLNVIKTEPNEENFSCDRFQMDHKNTFNYLSDNILCTDFEMTVDNVHMESENKRDNLNLLNEIGFERNEVNSFEEIIIKTEDNEDYIDENTDIFLRNDVNNKEKQITIAKCFNKSAIYKKNCINKYRSFGDVDQLQIEETLKKDIKFSTNCIDVNNSFSSDSKYVTSINSINQINYSQTLFENLEKEVINVPKENLSNQKNTEKQLYLDKSSSTNINIKVCNDLQNKNDIASVNLNLLNKVKTEPYKLNSDIFDCQPTELIIKTEDNENYILENNDLSFDGELINKNKMPTKKQFLYSDKLPSTNINIKVCNELQNKNDIANKVKTEPYELNSDTFDCQPTEELIIKTEENGEDNVSFEGELINKNKTSTAKQFYECALCKKIFTVLRSFTYHMMNHRGERPYECIVCKGKFINTNRLNIHMKIHSGERPYECTVCKKTFIQSAALKIHMRIHTGERPYACTVCSKAFNLPATLQGHMRTHTGERPYDCTTCKKTFAQKAVLKIHMRTHTGERPYKCTECKKTFNQSSGLTYHMRTHTGEQSYACSVCKKTFSLSGNLRKHMLIHTGERPHTCKTCNKSFLQLVTLKTHMKIHTER